MPMVTRAAESRLLPTRRNLSGFTDTAPNDDNTGSGAGEVTGKEIPASKVDDTLSDVTTETSSYAVLGATETCTELSDHAPMRMFACSGVPPCGVRYTEPSSEPKPIPMMFSSTLEPDLENSSAWISGFADGL